MKDIKIFAKDIPEKCSECQFLVFPSIISSYKDGGHCGVTIKYIHECNESNFRPDWCPIRELKEGEWIQILKTDGKGQIVISEDDLLIS